MKEEIWKDVVGYEGLYQVSNLGRIKSIDRIIKCPLTKNKKAIKRGRILKIQTNIHRVFLCAIKQKWQTKILSNTPFSRNSLSQQSKQSSRSKS